MDSPSTDLVLKHYTLPFQLKPFQLETIDLLCKHDRSAGFLPVGTGKTVVSTVGFLYKAITGQVDQVIILMPPIILNQWQEWLESLGLESLIYRGTPAQRKAMSLDADIIMMTFNIFKNDHKRIMSTFRDRNVCLVVDEAAAIRRSQTLTFTAVSEFMGDLKASPVSGARHLVLLTGTAMNKPYHAYGYIKLKTPEYFPRGYNDFLLAHVASVNDRDEPNGYRELKLLTEILMLQAIKFDSADILDLPEILYSQVPYRLAPGHMRLYDRLVEKQLLELEDGKVINAVTQQAMYHACQKIILDPATGFVPEAFSLIDLTWEEMGEGEKLIVYVNYRDSNVAVFNHIMSGAKQSGMKPLQAYGALGATKNLKNVEEFLRNKDVNVLVANPGSIGIGLNLQSVCRVILFLELPIAPDVYIQAVGRIYREGQKKSCIIKFAIAKGTIQEYLRRAVVRTEDKIQELMPTRHNLRLALMGERKVK